MFTGIIAERGTIVGVENGGDAMRLVFDAGRLADLAVGDSIAVNGVCLTAVTVEAPMVSVDVMSETLDRSSLGRLREGELVNLERPLPASGRFDGHVVQGHVDGVGVIRDVTDDVGGRRLRFEVPSDLDRYVVEKGSITLDGVSLTVSAIGEGWAEVALIPHTLEVTNLGLRSVGDEVNLEVDILAKYVEKLLKAGT
jgi:riboflavin synthase